MNEIQKPYLRGLNPGNRHIIPLLYPVHSGWKFTPSKEGL
jgi:hypothetical protein